MWFPEVWLGEGEKKKGMEGMAERMSRMPHRRWVVGGQRIEFPQVLGGREAEEMLGRWEGSGGVCVGMRHGRMIGPYAWITAASELGIAYVEDFVDEGSFGEQAFPSRWHSEALSAFAGMLFRRVEVLRVLILPVCLRSFFWDGLVYCEQTEGRAWIVRKQS